MYPKAEITDWADREDKTDNLLKIWLSQLSNSDIVQHLSDKQYDEADAALLKMWQQGRRADLPRLSQLLISAMGGASYADIAKYIIKEWVATIIYSPMRPAPGTWDVYAGVIPDNLEDLEELLLNVSPERCHSSLRFLRGTITRQAGPFSAKSVVFPEEKPRSSRWRQAMNKLKTWWAG